MIEKWSGIKDFPSYEVSNLGKVRRIFKDYRTLKIKGKYQEMTLYNNKRNGYVYVWLNENGKGYNKRIHRLVAETFIPNPKNKPQVNHKDGNKQNNHYSNLEWCTNRENVIHAYKNKLTKHYTRKILQYDLKGNFIKEWESIKKASDYYKIYGANIVKCCKKQIPTSYGYIWKYKEDLGL